MARTLKQALLGDPLHTREVGEQRLSNPVALAIFSSDALSSVAYATEEILLMLVVAGSGALLLATPIAIAIGVLLVIVVVSYRQTIKAYPSGGGAYVVAKENLGTIPGLVAGGEIIEPISAYVHAISRPTDSSVITVLIPQFVPEDWSDYGGVYVYRAGLRHWIKRALFSERNVIVADVPYYLRPEGRAPGGGQ